MPFVSTGFPALDRMIAGDGDCMGFPTGGLSLLVGATGSGKTTVLKKICERVHDRGLSVVWIEPNGGSLHSYSSKYPVVANLNSVGDLAHLTSKLLHPGNQKNRANLIVVDEVKQFTVDPDGSIATLARSLSAMFQGDLGSTAVVLSVQSSGRSLSGTVREYDPPVSLGHQSILTLGIAKKLENYDLKLVKSIMSHAGVSCTINPGDLIDRSKIPTRYERILRGRY